MPKAEITYIENKDQAQALANFLWNEKQRHLDDIVRIDKDLLLLFKHFHIKPNKCRVYVEVIRPMSMSYDDKGDVVAEEIETCPKCRSKDTIYRNEGAYLNRLCGTCNHAWRSKDGS